jgi:hypothetical protein
MGAPYSLLMDEYTSQGFSFDDLRAFPVDRISHLSAQPNPNLAISRRAGLE